MVYTDAYYESGIALVLQRCRTIDRIDGERTPQDIFNHAVSEIGELGQELIIANGRSYKEAGPDGIIGEACDVILCMIDMIHSQTKSMTAFEVERMMADTFTKKCDKWVAKIGERK